jgi:hypothetical protein
MNVQSTIMTAASNVVSTAPAALDNEVKASRTVEREVVKLHRVNLRTTIESQGSMMFSVDYEKLNGKARTLTGRLGVTSHLKGGKNNVEADDRSYLTVFDTQIKQYRTVNLATVTELRANRKIYRVID